MQFLLECERKSQVSPQGLELGGKHNGHISESGIEWNPTGSLLTKLGAAYTACFFGRSESNRPSADPILGFLG